METRLYAFRYLLPVLLLSAIVFMASCEKGNGVMTTQSFELQNFNKINVVRHADVYVTQGPARSVTIEAEENLMDLITTDVVDGEWKIDFSKTVKEYLTMQVYITMPDVQALRITDGSGGDIVLETTITSDNLNLEVSGDGSISGAVQVAENLSTRLVGSGNIDVSGNAARHEAHTTGSGLLSAWGLDAATGSVNLTGSGDALVRFSGDWSATLTGSGNIRYKGVAPIASDVTGSGTVVAVP